MTRSLNGPGVQRMSRFCQTANLTGCTCGGVVAVGRWPLLHFLLVNVPPMALAGTRFFRWGEQSQLTFAINKIDSTAKTHRRDAENAES